MHVGVVGLGKMGSIVARRLVRDRHTVAGFDLDGERSAQLEPELRACDSLEALVAALSAPRLIWLMLPSGGPVASAIGELAPFLEAGDVVVEGGNSDFRTTAQHATALAAHGVALLDVGVSGGIWGLDDGCGLLVGGDEGAVSLAAPAFDAVAARDGWAHVGPSGAGHYAKMVHNAIEYGVMEAYAEGYELLTAAPVPIDTTRTVAVWNVACSIRAWLLGHFAAVLADNPGLDGVPGRVGDSGQGRWSIEQAVDLGVPVPAIAAAVFARLGSQQNDAPAMQAIAALRQQVGGHRAPTAA